MEDDESANAKHFGANPNVGNHSNLLSGADRPMPRQMPGVGGIVEVVVRASDISIYVRCYFCELKNLSKCYLIYIL